MNLKPFYVVFQKSTGFNKQRKNNCLFLLNSQSVLANEIKIVSFFLFYFWLWSFVRIFFSFYVFYTKESYGTKRGKNGKLVFSIVCMFCSWSECKRAFCSLLTCSFWRLLNIVERFVSGAFCHVEIGRFGQVGRIGYDWECQYWLQPGWTSLRWLRVSFYWCWFESVDKIWWKLRVGILLIN